MLSDQSLGRLPRGSDPARHADRAARPAVRSTARHACTRAGRRCSPAAILILGLPTTAIDAYNAADITQPAHGARAFRWTVILSPGQQEALRWVRRDHARDWPSFRRSRSSAARSVEPDPLVRRAAHVGRPADLAAADAGVHGPRGTCPGRSSGRDRSDDAHAIARELKIDYLWVDGTDRAAYPDRRRALLAADPTLFTPVFQNDEVTVYGVR